MNGIKIYSGAVKQKIASALQHGFPDMHSAAIHSDLDTCCRQTLPRTVCPRLYFAVTHLPTTPSGKIDRRFCELHADALNPFRLHPRATVSEERHEDPLPSSHCGGEETLSTPSILEKVRCMWHEMVSWIHETSKGVQGGFWRVEKVQDRCHAGTEM